MYQKHWHHDFEYSDRLINTGIGTEEFFKAIEKALPPVVARAELARLTGGLISAKTLSNEDALQKGPGGALHSAFPILWACCIPRSRISQVLKSTAVNIS